MANREMRKNKQQQDDNSKENQNNTNRIMAQSECVCCTVTLINSKAKHLVYLVIEMDMFFFCRHCRAIAIVAANSSSRRDKLKIYNICKCVWGESLFWGNVFFFTLFTRAFIPHFFCVNFVTIFFPLLFLLFSAFLCCQFWFVFRFVKLKLRDGFVKEMNYIPIVSFISCLCVPSSISCTRQTEKKRLECI